MANSKLNPKDKILSFNLEGVNLLQEVKALLEFIEDLPDKLVTQHDIKNELNSLFKLKNGDWVSDEIFKKYHLWSLNIKEYLSNDESASEYLEPHHTLSLYEPDSVPYMKGGPEYSYINSDKTLELLRRIDKEIRLKNTKLARIIDTMKQGQDYLVSYTDDTFFYNRKPIIIENQKSLYFLIFQTIYNLVPFGGYVEYTEINQQITKEGEKNISDFSEMRKRIQNAVVSDHQGFFRYAKIRDKNLIKKIKNETLRKGEKLIAPAERGKSLKFNNRTID